MIFAYLFGVLTLILLVLSIHYGCPFCPMPELRLAVAAGVCLVLMVVACILEGSM